MVLAALLLATGVAALLDGVGLVDMDVRAYLALALTVVGAGLITGAWIGRARWLIAVGLLLIPPLIVAGVVRDSLRDDGDAERVEAPASLADVRPSYRQTAGQLTLDLSNVTFTEQARSVDASVGLGRLVVVVPEDVTVEVDAQVGAGSVELFGDRAGGGDDPGDGGSPGADEHVTSTGTPEGGRLELDTRAGLGEIVVRRGP